MTYPWRHRCPTPLLLACLLVLVTGCAARRMEGTTVRRIQFEGNGSAVGASSDYALRGPMAQRASPPFTWLRPAQAVALDAEELYLDAWRLETWLAHRGYFDARFLGWEIIEHKPANERRGAIVSIRGHVDLGRPSLVRSVELLGSGPAGRPLVALITQEAEVEPGTRFDIEQVETLQTEARLLLREQSYAHADAVGHAEAHPTEQAVDLTVDLSLGPPSVFGPVTIGGSTTIASDLILQEVEIEEGEPFQLSALSRTQQRLFGLGVFSVVQVMPLLQTDEAGQPNPVVPVHIEVASTTARQFRVGGGLAAESAHQEATFGVEFEHANVFNRLWRLRLGAESGYASVLQWSEYPALGLQGLRDNGAPVVAVDASLAIPRFPGRRWRFENELAFELGVEPEYRFATPSGSTSLAWTISRRWTSRLGYRIQYFDYFRSTLPENLGVLDRRGRNLGLDFSDPYLLSMLVQQLTYDSRDDQLYTRRGGYGLAELAEAGGPVGGQYNFFKATVDGRIWRPLPMIFGWKQRITLTARLAGGFAAPYGDESKAEVPFAERLQVGGTPTVRGWGRGHLGPYLYPCGGDEVCSSAVTDPQPVDDPDLDTDDIIYIGGRAALYGGFEVRGYWAQGLARDWGLAGFLDFGRAWDGAGVTGVDDLQARVFQISTSLGVGLRYRSPIGPIRLDVARRMDSFAMFQEEPRVVAHLGLSEAW